MSKYRVIVREICEYEFEVEAGNEEAAGAAAETAFIQAEDVSKHFFASTDRQVWSIEAITEPLKYGHHPAKGELVMWKGGWGADAPRYATVTDDTGVKNGRPVYDLDTGNWAYSDQLARIPFVKEVRDHAVEHYNDQFGWSEIVECWTDKDIANKVLGAGSVEEAIARLQPTVDLRSEQWDQHQAEADAGR